MLQMSILAMIAFILFCAVFITKVIFKNLYLGKLNKSYAKENEEVKKLDAVSDKTGIIKRFLSQKAEALDVLVELFNAMPGEVYLSSVILKEDDTLTFTGTADSMSMVFSLVTDLENNSYFSNVKVDFTKTRKQKGIEVSDFGLTLSLEQQV
jgi:Tfp pilus assembly protein PilN